MMRKAAAVVPGLMLLWAGACSDGTLGVVEAQQYDPPPVYADWWAEMEACSRESGALGQVVWFVAGALTFKGEQALGLWEPPHTIFILAGQTGNERVVKHEMVHDLLRGDPDHNGAAWQACEVTGVPG